METEGIKLILLVGSVAAAVTAVIALVVKIVKVVKKVIDYFKNLKDSVDTLLKHDKDQYKAILKLTVMSDNMPLSERISAAKEYLELGGNGDVKAYYEENLKPYDKVEVQHEKLETVD